jgi:hypothetical protein
MVPIDPKGVTASRGCVADKRSSWFLMTWATVGKFRRFQAQVKVITFKAEFPQLRNRCRSKRGKELGLDRN